MKTVLVHYLNCEGDRCEVDAELELAPPLLDTPRDLEVAARRWLADYSEKVGETLTFVEVEETFDPELVRLGSATPLVDARAPIDAATAYAAIKACAVIALNPEIRRWLARNDPRALAQVETAISGLPEFQAPLRAAQAQQQRDQPAAVHVALARAVLAAAGEAAALEVLLDAGLDHDRASATIDAAKQPENPDV